MGAIQHSYNLRTCVRTGLASIFIIATLSGTMLTTVSAGQDGIKSLEMMPKTLRMNRYEMPFKVQVSRQRGSKQQCGDSGGGGESWSRSDPI